MAILIRRPGSANEKSPIRNTNKMTNSKLYVGNLTFNASENGLREIFSEAGEVRETAIITDKTTGQSRSFAFVTMADEAGAKRACEKFDNRDFLGRQLTVSIARPRQERPAGDFKSSRRRL
jgi:cold-inducible RNA-binding protein